MGLSRRGFLQKTAGGLAAAAVSGVARQPEGQAAVRVGMCDWNLRNTGKVEAIQVAKQIGLDGVEASVEPQRGDRGLRDPERRAAYREAATAAGIGIPSVALGVLNGVPLKSEPKAALWLADSIEVAHELGAKCILIAFFGRGALRMEDQEDITRVVDVLKELAPRAQEADVILGLENTLSAEDNLKIMEACGEPSHVQVYYDFKNSAGPGRDVVAEVKMLGGRICQVHLKNGPNLLSDITNVEWPACAQALKDINYQGWYILETSAPSGDLVKDTQANVAYVKETFG